MLFGFSAKTEPTSTSTTTTETASYRSRDPMRSCTHYGRKGHEVSEFFLLHGYPLWYQEQYQRSNNTSPAQGFRGGREGRSGGRGRGRASHTTASMNNDSIASLNSLHQNQQSNLSSERLSGKKKYY